MSHGIASAIIAEALAPELSMVPFKRDAAFVLYIGLWGVWWINGSDPSGMKVVLATIPKENAPTNVQPMRLSQLPWVILQLQSLDGNVRGTFEG